MNVYFYSKPFKQLNVLLISIDTAIYHLVTNYTPEDFKNFGNFK